MAVKGERAEVAAKPAARPRAKAKAGRVARRTASGPIGGEARGAQWPVWTAVVLTGLYLLLHLNMVPVALSLWGGLLSAFVLGQ